MKVKFARRTNWDLSSNRLTIKLNELRKDNIPILDLTESNPTHCDFQYPYGKILKSLSIAVNRQYDPSPQGVLLAREFLSDYYKNKNTPVSPDQIFFTSSTSEAYSYLFRLLVNPNEKVIFPSPSYPLFPFIADLNDILGDYYLLSYDNRWSIDIEQLFDSIDRQTKAIVLVNPNNPTGSFIKREELSKINSICQENNCALICDEVFGDFAFSPNEKGVSLVNNDSVLTFVLGGLSKTLGLPQMKLSWIIINGPQDLVREAQERLEVITDTYLSVNTPVQNSLGSWLALKDEIQKELKMRIIQNSEFLKAQTQSSNIQYLKNEGGWYSILRLPEIDNEEKFVLDLLIKDHVYVHPGYFFDFAEGTHIILSLLPSNDIFQQGLERILKRL